MEDGRIAAVAPIAGRREWFAPGEPSVAVLVAVVVALGAWHRSPAEVLVLAAGSVAVTRRWRVGAGVAAVGLVVVLRSGAVHGGLAPDQLGPYAGWATVAADPDPSFGSTRRPAAD